MLEFGTLIDRDKDRILTIPEATWSEYETLKSLNRRELISFSNNTITMHHSKSAKSLKGTMAHMRRAPGTNHERIAEAIRTVVAAYCRKY